jgi:hypothetical protein
MSYASVAATEYTIDNLLAAFKILLEKLQALRSKVGFPIDDARQVGLFGMQEAVVGFGLTAHAISGNGLKGRARTGVEVVESFDNYVTIEGKTSEDLVAITQRVWRLSLLTIFHFKIDALFQNLLTGLGEKPAIGFGANLNALTNQITLQDRQRVRDTLKTPTLIRNSLHNNGIHRFADWGPVTHHGLIYEFNKDKDLRCASFGHILAALDVSVDALDEILQAPEITSLTRVEDLYVMLNPT